MKMHKYLVVSYDDDQQQWFYDMVLSDSEENAAHYVCLARPYVIAADATEPKDFFFDSDCGYDASIPLTECANCGDIYPADRLKPIKDYHERVAPGEVAPSGECPDCGALCHPVELA